MPLIRRSLPFASVFLILLMPSVLSGARAASPTFHARMVEDINNVQTRFYPSGISQLGSQVLFDAGIFDGYVSSDSVWQTDGSSSGTLPFKVPGTSKGFPTNFTPLGPSDVFVENYSGNGPELWLTDGTAGGTAMLKAFHDYDDMLSFVSIGDTIYFLAVKNYSEYYLWKTDGTPGGTLLVAKIPEPAPNFYLAQNNFNRNITVNNGSAYGNESNAAVAGDFGKSAAFLNIVPRLVPVGQMLYVFAGTKKTGTELWKSDGTTPGTGLVKDIAAGPDASDPSDLVAVGNTLFFTADDGIHGRQLWKTNGSASGTKMVKFVLHSDPTGLVAAGNDLLFTATRACLSYSGVCHSSKLGKGLWVSDGTSNGTFEIKHLDSKTHASLSRLTYLTMSAGKPLSLFAITYQRQDGTVSSPDGSSRPKYVSVQQIWRTDGSVKGTTLLKIIRPGFSSGISSFTLLSTGGRTLAVFSALDASHGRELWSTNGTPAGTMGIRDINPGPASSSPYNITAVTLGGSAAVIFSADDGTHGPQLWRSDGTPANTIQLGDVNRATASSNPGNFMQLGKGMDFLGLGPSGKGSERVSTNIYRTFGSSKNTTNLGIVPGYFNGGVMLGNEEIYVCDSGQHSVKICRIGTSKATTGLLRVFKFRGNPQSYFDYRIAAAGKNAFVFGGNHLWVTDGTPAGTNSVKTFGTDTNDSNGPYATSQSALLFTLTQDKHSDQVWESNGSVQGTTQLALPKEPGAYRHVGLLQRDGSNLFIAAHQGVTTNLFIGNATGAHVRRLYSIRDSGQNHAAVKSINAEGAQYLISVYQPGAGDELFTTVGATHKPQLLVRGTLTSLLSWPISCRDCKPNARVRLYLSVYNPSQGHVLYLSDATTGGTKPLIALRNIDSLTLAHSRLYFIAAEGSHGNELWTSDGTSKGTRLVKDLRLGVGGSNIQNMTAFNNGLIFDANDGKTGNELWRSNGTSSGTSQVKDLAPGLDSSNPYDYTMFDGKLFFIAYTKSDSFSLWETDGTNGGTHLVRSLLGFSSDSISQPIVVGGLLYFSALDNRHGTELWAVNPA